jgi:hypothetical protein
MFICRTKRVKVVGIHLVLFVYNIVYLALCKLCVHLNDLYLQ